MTMLRASLIITTALFLLTPYSGATAAEHPGYIEDLSRKTTGIDKFYMGREISFVMGHQRQEQHLACQTGDNGDRSIEQQFEIRESKVHAHGQHDDHETITSQLLHGDAEKGLFQNKLGNGGCFLIHNVTLIVACPV